MLAVDDLIAKMAPILASYPEIAVSYLFGSAARGEMRPDSDVDVGIVQREDRLRLECDRLIGDLASRLELATLPHAVDVVVLEDQGPVFAHRAISEGRRIHVADEAKRIQFETDTVIRGLDFLPTYRIAEREQVAGARRWVGAWLEKRRR